MPKCCQASIRKRPDAGDISDAGDTAKLDSLLVKSPRSRSKLQNKSTLLRIDSESTVFRNQPSFALSGLLACHIVTALVVY